MGIPRLSSPPGTDRHRLLEHIPLTGKKKRLRSHPGKLFRRALRTVRTRQLCLLCQAHTTVLTGGRLQFLYLTSVAGTHEISLYLADAASTGVSDAAAYVLQTCSALVAGFHHLPHAWSFGVLAGTDVFAPVQTPRAACATGTPQVIPAWAEVSTDLAMAHAAPTSLTW